MHGVDQQADLVSAYVFDGGHGGRQVRDGKAGNGFDARHDASIGGQLGEHGKFIERAGPVRTPS